MNKKIMINSLLLSVFVTSCATEKKVTSIDPKVSDAILVYENKANKIAEKNIDLIAPLNFKKLNEKISDAKEIAYSGSSLEDVEKILATSKPILSEIEKTAKFAKTHIPNVLKARKEALDENAQNLELFKEAESELVELGESLERKDINEVIDEKDEVFNLYVKAEVKAIQDRELMSARKYLEKANELSSSDSFSKERAIAIKSIDSAMKLIKDFKDDHDRHKDSVKTAYEDAKRYYSLCLTGDWVKGKDTREMSLLLDSNLNSMLEPLSYENTDLMSAQNKLILLQSELNYIPFLKDQLTLSQYDSYLKNKNIKKLKKNNQKISDKLASERMAKEKLAKIRSMFSEDEAKILIKGDDLIIKLVGVNFDFDKSKIPSSSKPILKKVGKVAKTLDYPEIEIVGHADTKGDASYNQTLSYARAENVNRFLVNQTKISDQKTKVKGVGYKKPIVDNKTKKSRETNRRIDLVFNSTFQ